MNFFERMVLSAKVERGTLKAEEFEKICDAYLAEDKKAEEILKQFFYFCIPNTEMLGYLYLYKARKIREMYFASMGDRHLTEEEQLMYVRFMSFDDDCYVPHPLDERALYELFVVRSHDVTRMQRYVSHYEIPEEYVLKLLELAKKQRSPYKVNVYAKMLYDYVTRFEKPVFNSPEIQEALLGYHEPVIRELYAAKACNLTDTFLSDEMIATMVEDNNMLALRIAIYNSRIQSEESRDLIAKKIPYLAEAIKISEIRYSLYEEEIRLGIFCGVTTPSTQERHFLKIREINKDEFPSLLMQKLHEPENTAYLLVWAAEHYQAFEPSVLKKLQAMSAAGMAC